MTETQYGEIIFSKNGGALGVIWKPEPNVNINKYRAKLFGNKEIGTTIINSGREDAIQWILDRS